MVSAIMPILIRRVEIPKVTIASGRAKSLISGLTTEFTIEKMTPATMKSMPSIELGILMRSKSPMLTRMKASPLVLTLANHEMQSHIPKTEATVRRRKIEICFLIMSSL